MSVDNAIDIFTLIGLLGFPLYLAYWVWAQFRAGTRRRLWWAVLALITWMAATFFLFLLPMFGCMGGGCAGKASPLLHYAILYAACSVALILLLQWLRRKGRG